MDRVKRRTFLGRAGASALGMLTAGPELLTDAIGVGAAGKTSITDWEDTVLTHGRSTRDRPSPLMLADLSTDLAQHRARRLLAALPPPARTLPAARDLHEVTMAYQGRVL